MMRSAAVPVLKPAPPRSPTYRKLLADIRRIIEKGRLQIQKINIQNFWRMGRCIHRDILKNKSRAEYGEKVFEDLARDLKIDDDFLYDARNFYVANPIFSTLRKLSVSHQRALLHVPDLRLRNLLMNQTDRLGWSVGRLRSEIQGESVWSRRKGRRKEAGRRLIPRQGKTGVYRMVRSKIRSQSHSEKLWLDLGFYDYERIPEKAGRRFRAGDLVEGRSFGTFKKIGEEKSRSAKRLLFTYKAHVLDVIDTDTLWVVMEKWENRLTQKKLRLRGIDAPEINTKAGRAGKIFLQKLLAAVPFVTVTTSKLGKFDRYVVDLFAGEVFVNQLLVDRGYARLL